MLQRSCSVQFNKSSLKYFKISLKIYIGMNVNENKWRGGRSALDGQSYPPSPIVESPVIEKFKTGMLGQYINGHFIKLMIH